MLKKMLVMVVISIFCVSVISLATARNPLNPDEKESDADKDGLFTSQEYDNGSDPNNADSDNDGLPDGWEVNNLLDPVDPTDAHKDNDYLTPSFKFNGEIDATFSALKYSFDVWPSDGKTTVAADLHYDNYEEYYRAFNYVDSIPVDQNTPNSVLLNGVWVVFGHTDPNKPDSDSDNILDPDDDQPKNYRNDGTGYSTSLKPQNYDLSSEYNSQDPLLQLKRIQTKDVMSDLQGHNSILMSSEFA